MTSDILLLLVVLFSFPSWAVGEEPTLHFLYLKSGVALHCDAVWKGMGDYLWCAKSRGSQGFPMGEVDTRRTFDIQLAVNRLLDKSVEDFNRGDWDLVISATTSAISMEPTNEVAYTNRAGAYAYRGLYELAIQDCNQAVKINPYFGLAYNNRGYALERMDRPEQALADYVMSCRLGNALGCNNYQRLKLTLQHMKTE